MGAVRRWWWLWAQCPGVGPARLAHLQRVALEHGTDLGGLWTWPLDQLRMALRWSDPLICALERHRQRLGPDPRLLLPQRLLLPVDSQWPKGFHALDRPPVMVFWEGNESLFAPLGSGHAVAVVGSRRPSAHGLRAAEKLGEALARAGWPVVSGLAEGIDAAVHQGCLRGGGQPVAVLGTPLERAYPPEHRQLQSDVARAGLLITELAPGGRVQRSSFALRNRLLVALAQTVVVVECPEGSGALLSAKAAKTQGRALWAMPADALRHSARGSNQLLIDQARPLLDPEQWVEALGAGPLTPLGGVPGLRNAVASHKALHDPALLTLLEDGATLQHLAQGLGRSPAALAQQLVQLELEGVLKAEAGMRWRLA